VLPSPSGGRRSHQRGAGTRPTALATTAEDPRRRTSTRRCFPGLTRFPDGSFARSFGCGVERRGGWRRAEEASAIRRATASGGIRPAWLGSAAHRGCDGRPARDRERVPEGGGRAGASATRLRRPRRNRPTRHRPTSAPVHNWQRPVHGPASKPANEVATDSGCRGGRAGARSRSPASPTVSSSRPRSRAAGTRPRSTVGAHQEPRNSGRVADGLRIVRKLAGVAVHG
jgi:hypothetical protein